MPGAFSQNSSKSPQEAQSHSPRAQPSSPTVPQAWSHGMPPSTLQNGPSRTRQPSLTDVLYCPEAIVSLVGVLQRLAACWEHKRAPEVYVAFTVRNPETCQLFTTELGEPPRPPGPTWSPSCPCRTPVEVKELGAGEKLGCPTLPHYAGNSGRGRPGWDQMGSGSSS
ncbi:putative protein N-methyltransferase FAM86B2 isoform X12 [Homo sapiens]|uniref:putative protein N-methyltransferase FAM86B2 isoform X12 n=1 Tax=Homo sapiens TaxID=9606 RepID=UPI0023E01970|nr:putative protein N-methyltransferase FAM86B2 isoform X12 [Homo sapiens]XP_054217644.1 putative protein N-methyltransferase FAM86B2 isoform X12 [Homo sapiens]